jgi:hypothetical protein
MNLNCDFTTIIIFIIIFSIIYCLLSNKWKCKCNNIEKMSPGVIDQLFAKDQQDMHLNAKMGNIASGRFNLFWNQPTLIANTTTNRGKLYNPPNYILGNNSSNTNHAKMVKLTKDVANINNNNTRLGNNNVLEIEKLTHKTEPLHDPAGNGTGPGGFRLNTDIVNPIYNGSDFVSLDGELVYPSSYLGDLYMQPKPDLMYPYGIMENVV